MRCVMCKTNKAAISIDSEFLCDDDVCLRAYARYKASKVRELSARIITLETQLRHAADERVGLIRANTAAVAHV